MRKRRFVWSVDILSLVFIAWVGVTLIPLGWFWYDPGQVVISNSSIENPPRVDFSRKISRPVIMKYQVIIRDIERNAVVCDPASEPFTYSPDARFPDDADLVWWTGGDDRCWPREPGTYIAETCWTATHLFWGLIPDKTVCRTSNPFTINLISPEEAEQVIQKQQDLESQVEGLSRGLEMLQHN
ncbi:hypothetical protein [uncultured Ruegeria sp.]|uniref:hypothetical protein n=1 Tax=uncultured Ruegeria sp. TaxID=259304 RepID=UPI002601C113|nr:hypothetical protein [uncultured Ruegeria sp.]